VTNPLRGAPANWKTFLRNTLPVAAIDLSVVATVPFKLLYGLVVLHHDR
jgi:hypothetical protein